jgi:hypothetical protein|tara:strand:- start:624 stop:761 length:138 start_codon:yes stop_codon:yes gene_type:complete
MHPELPLLSKKDSKRSTTPWLPRTMLTIPFKPTPKNGTMPPQEST